MNTYVIGVDGGASKTAAVVLDEDRRVLGRGNAGSSNCYTVGLEQTRFALSIAMRGAVDDAGIGMDQVTATTWALAGVDRPEERDLFESLAAQYVPGIPVQVENDAVAALVGGVGARYGIVLIAGTGTNTYGENRQGDHTRAGGWGHFLDHGSAYDLAQEALRAVALAVDGRRSPTRLTARILDSLNLEKPTDLLGWVYARDREVSEIAALAPLVLAEAEAGDLLAVDVVSRGADALAEAVDTVSQRLGHWSGPFPVVFTGGLLTRNDFYPRLVAQAIHTRVPHARPIAPRADAAVGAALLALEALGHSLEPQVDVQASGSSINSPQGGDVWMSEQRNALTHDLDLRTTFEIVGLMHLEDRRAVAAVRPVLPAIAEAVDAIADRMRRDGRLIYVGAGTSGRLGVLDASECPPTFNADPSQVVGIIAGGERALVSSVEAAEDDPDAGRQAIANAGVGPHDSVVGVAASGRTPYVVGALEEAGRRGALTVAVVCNLPAPVAEVAEHVIAPLVGPEVVTGSTRLKAGTAQKLVLNMLSTAVMVRLGKTYSNLMVDLQQRSMKLRDRARRIVAQACDISEEAAQAALDVSDGDVKVAIVSTLAGASPEAARRHLAEQGDVVRAALSRSESED